jgi:hypothetical protein
MRNMLSNQEASAKLTWAVSHNDPGANSFGRPDHKSKAVGNLCLQELKSCYYVRLVELTNYSAQRP